eukprot:2035625-Rhodomonas_salina.1
MGEARGSGGSSRAHSSHGHAGGRPAHVTRPRSAGGQRCAAVVAVVGVWCAQERGRSTCYRTAHGPAGLATRAENRHLLHSQNHPHPTPATAHRPPSGTRPRSGCWRLKLCTEREAPAGGALERRARVAVGPTAT